MLYQVLKRTAVTIEGITYDLRDFLCCDYKVSSYIAIVNIQL